MSPDREDVRDKLVELHVSFDVIDEFIRDCELNHTAFWKYPAESADTPLDGTRLWDNS